MVFYTVGARVAQAQYGNGTVTVANDRHTVIDFDEHGVRTFLTRMVQLEPSATMAPVKPAKRRRPARAARV